MVSLHDCISIIYIILLLRINGFRASVYIYLYTGPIGFSFDQDTYIVAESDDSIEVCVTPNRTLFCSEGDAFILMIVIDIDMDVRTSGKKEDTYVVVIIILDLLL